MEIAQRFILKFRLEKGYSQAYMAMKLNISQKSYHEIESGKTRLRVNDLLKIAEILQTHHCELIGFCTKEQSTLTCQIKQDAFVTQACNSELSKKLQVLENIIRIQNKVIEKLTMT